MAEAQNFTMSAINSTSETFTPTLQVVHGKVTNEQDIQPNTTAAAVVLQASGDANASQGTTGTGTYYNGDKTISFSISWDIPWGADTSFLEITGMTGCTVTPTKYTGDQIIRNTGIFTITT